jgi:hypothetical protein
METESKSSFAVRIIVTILVVEVVLFLATSLFCWAANWLTLDGFSTTLDFIGN